MLLRILSYSGFEDITLLWFSAYFSVTLFQFLRHFLLYIMLFSLYHYPREYIYPQSYTVYLLLCWGLQLRLLLHMLQISTWIRTDTSNTVILTLVFTQSAIFALIESGVTIILGVTEARNSRVILESSLSQAWSSGSHQLLSTTNNRILLLSVPLFLMWSRVWTAFLGACLPTSPLQFYHHLSIFQIWEVTDCQEHFHNPSVFMVSIWEIYN